MNNKHQELIAEKVAEFEKKKRELKDWQYGTVYKGYDQEEEAETLAENVDEFLTPVWFTQTLQDTIDTVLREERKRIKKEIFSLTLLNDGRDNYVNLGEALWVCDSKEDREAFTEKISLTTTP